MKTIDVRFVPMVSRHVDRSRRRAPFKADYSGTQRLLDRELRMLRAQNVVIQLDCDESQIRRDGMPKADARLRSPAVIVSFESKYGPLSYPADAFDGSGPLLCWSLRCRGAMMMVYMVRGRITFSPEVTTTSEVTLSLRLSEPPSAFEIVGQGRPTEHRPLEALPEAQGTRSASESGTNTTVAAETKQGPSD